MGGIRSGSGQSSKILSFGFFCNDLYWLAWPSREGAVLATLEFQARLPTEWDCFPRAIANGVNVIWVENRDMLIDMLWLSASSLCLHIERGYERCHLEMWWLGPLQSEQVKLATITSMHLINSSHTYPKASKLFQVMD